MFSACSRTASLVVLVVSGSICKKGRAKSGDDEDSAGHDDDDDDDDDVSITKSIFLRHTHCLKHQRDRG